MQRRSINAAFSLAIIVAVQFGIITKPSFAQQNSSPDFAFFESSIRPILVKHCYECHSESSGVSESNLLVDSRDAIRKGGDRGAAIVPGEPEKSLLLAAISHADSDLEMPPRVEMLPAQTIADFKRWIDSGAPDPRDSADKSSTKKAARDFWAYQAPIATPVPKTSSDWPRNDVDHFVLNKLNAHELQPSPDANTLTLLRRIYFDLTGLPPSPEQIDQFLSRIEEHDIDHAIAECVDTLLQQPTFGERWGRHWLDVARFGESSGKEANISFPYAWRYRDYVIDAFNADVPFDRFVTEQIAGDLLPSSDDAERTRLLIATGFLAIGPKNLDSSQLQFEADLIDEQIDAFSRVFMASSIACARCHDHKFDPFSASDYYALAGIFASTKTYFGTAVSPSNRIAGDPLELPLLKSTPILHKSIPAEKVAKLKADKEAMRKEREDKNAKLTLRDVLRIIWRTGSIDGQLEKVDENGNALPLAMGVLESGEVRDAPLLLRGEVNRPDEIVPRAFPVSIRIDNAPLINQKESGRRELAKWLTHPDHPLTSRVIVNRVWSHLFGEGLVKTIDDFGSTGQSPSHPELLDNLAIEFVRDGWSVKRLIRKLMLSRAYRQASNFDKVSFRIDPENRLLWRMPKRRLEAEAMRDSMLSVSGELDLQRPIGSLVGNIVGDRPVSLVGLNKRLPKDLDGATHRSVYLPVLRDRLPDVFEVFDFAEPSLVTGKRESTNVPTQALYLMNSEFVFDRATAMAKRLRSETSNNKQFVNRAFRLCYGRLPTNDEAKKLLAFLGDDKTKDVHCCQALLSTVEFRVLD